MKRFINDPNNPFGNVSNISSQQSGITPILSVVPTPNNSPINDIDPVPFKNHMIQKNIALKPTIPPLINLTVEEAIFKLSKTPYKLRVAIENGINIVNATPELFNKEINISNYLFDLNRINVSILNNVIIKVLGNY